MTVKFVFDQIDLESNTPVSNLTGSYYNQDWSNSPYWFEWGGDINKHLLRDSVWSTQQDRVFKCTLTSEPWDLFARFEILKDVPYEITVDIKLITAENCNISILDSDYWTLLSEQSFDKKIKEWTSITLQMLPSKSGAIHLHIGALNNNLPKQIPGTVLIKNLRVKSNSNNLYLTAFSCQNGKYTDIDDCKLNYVLLSEINNNDFNLYPIVITTAEHFYCWPLLLLSRKIVDLINNDHLKILFICSFETIREDLLSIHKHVQKICELQQIKKLDNIIFASTDSTLQERNITYRKNMIDDDPEMPMVKFVDINGYGYIMPKILHQFNNIDWLENYCSVVDKSSVFLYLNNRTTFHRYLCYKILQYKNLLKHSLHSWNNYVAPNAKFKDNFTNFLSWIESDSENKKFIQFVKDNPSIETKTIDDDPATTKALLTNPLTEGSLLNPNWISDTYFSVVTETHVGDMPSHVTEKIYKLIFCCHPFIVIGPKDHLATLHRYGFKTFPFMFNESYDAMPETIEKYDFISDQIKFYTTDEGREKLKQIFPILRSILEYNRNHLLSLSSDDVWNSLEQLYENN